MLRGRPSSIVQDIEEEIETLSCNRNSEDAGLHLVCSGEGKDWSSNESTACNGCDRFETLLRPIRNIE